MQIKALLILNFKYFKRNWKLSLTEILLPILLPLLIAYLRNKTDVTTNNGGSSMNFPLISNNLQINNISKFINSNIFGNCGTSRGGSIGLAPQTPITEKLESIFLKLNYSTHMFNSNAELESWTQTSDYTSTFSNGTKKQLCFGIVLDSYSNNQYQYQLRYNLSGNPATNPHPYTTSSSYRISNSIDSQTDFLSLIKNGIIYVQTLVDGLILNLTNNYSFSAVLKSFYTPTYQQADFSAAMDYPFVLCITIINLIIFLRFISKIVSEREYRNIENMENMGMSKFKYLMCLYIYNLILHFILGIIFSIICKKLVFIQIPFIMIFITYFLFIIVNITLASLVSCFFINTKKSIIGGLIIYFILMMIWFLKDTFDPTTVGGNIALSLSPHAGLSKLVSVFLIFENNYKTMSWTDLQVNESGYYGTIYFIICFLESIIFFISGLYLLYVYPLEIGIAKHPLFFLGYPKENTNLNFNDPSAISSKLEMFNDPENFEPLEKELLAQLDQKQTISLKKVYKVYENGKTAVVDLNLDIFKDKIYVLLGHNGAGKSTTISMISGYIINTFGNISIMGYDSRKDHDEIKKLMGICPQTNPVFSYLTVKEHLELYSRIKGNINDLELNIKQILTDLDLYHKLNYLAGNLSGGQKRKLCVALALIGNSKVVLLDEPTSGMDTYARRHLWEMLKKYKKDRIIILTTHNMDEADYLGDKIGIMSDGRLVTNGSSIFLKKKFGDGYELDILKKKEHSPETDNIIQELISKHINDYECLENIGLEMKYRINSSSEDFAALFDEFETNKSNLCIESYGISLSTLEKVFLKIASINHKNLQKNKVNEKNDKLKIEESIEISGLTSNELDQMDLSEFKIKSSFKIFILQLKSLTYKRFIYFSRDKSSIICQVILPILIIILGLLLSKIQFIKTYPALEISTTIYPELKDLKYGYSNSFDQSYIYQLMNIVNSKNINSIDSQINNFDLFDKYLFDNSNDNQLFGYYFNQGNTLNSFYTNFVNSTANMIPYISQNVISDSILKSITTKDAYIKMSFNPLPITSGIKDLQSLIAGFLITMLISLAYTFFASNLILFLIKERENNAKHQQLISGMSLYSYWLSNYIVDYIIYIVTSLIIFALFFIFGATFLTDGDYKGVCLLLFFLNGFALLGFVYIISFAFKKPSNGQIIVFIFNYISSFILLLTIFALKYNSSTMDLTTNILEYIVMIIPSFSFSYGFLMLSSISITIRKFNLASDVSPFDKYIAGKCIVYLAVMSVIFILILILIENLNKIKGLFISSKTIIPGNTENEVIDEDVIEEENEVNSNFKKFVVKVQNLWKIYSIKYFKNEKGKWINSKAAVKGISFGVEKGSVFSLLGTNGAGKTSTFKMLTGDVVQNSGTIFIQEKEMPNSFNEIKEMIGYCPQFDSILDNLTSYEHLSLFCNLKGIDPKYHSYLIEQMLTTMNLQEYRDIESYTYSGGNKRKLNVAIALIGKPPIIFLDEPSTGMDPGARKYMWNVISDVSKVKKTSSVILTTHSMEEAEALSSKVAIMVEGKIKVIGSTQRLKSKFGKDLEIEIKIELPSDLEVNEFKSELFSKLPALNKIEVTENEILEILKSFSFDSLYNEITNTGRGSSIRRTLDSIKILDLTLLIDWILLQNRLINVENELKVKFNVTTEECFQSYIKFKISNQYRLSEIFLFLESIKGNYRISTFVVKQVSLEQIFISLANEIIHDN